MSEAPLPSTAPAARAASAEDAAPVLRAEGLTRTFVDGQRRLEVLKGASLSVAKGEVVALVGKSGSGKSTLLHLLGLLDRPDSGALHVEGLDVAALPERRRARLRNHGIGFVFQHYFLLPEFNVLENLLIPAQVASSPGAWLRGGREQARRRAQELLEGVELTAQARQAPRTLSGGERQRVAIARALMLRPKLLLCDEPTGNLDPQTGARIMRLIFELSKRERLAAVVATHEPALAERARRVLRLDQGRLRTEREAAKG